MQQPFAPPYGQGLAGLSTAMRGFTPALRGFGTATRTAQTIGIEWFDYVKQSCDDLTAAAEKLAAARTPAQAVAVQTAFLHAAAERFSARSAVLAGLYLTLAGDLARPPGPLASQRAG